MKAAGLFLLSITLATAAFFSTQWIWRYCSSRIGQTAGKNFGRVIQTGVDRLEIAAASTHRTADGKEPASNLMGEEPARIISGVAGSIHSKNYSAISWGEIRKARVPANGVELTIVGHLHQNRHLLDGEMPALYEGKEPVGEMIEIPLVYAEYFRKNRFKGKCRIFGAFMELEGDIEPPAYILIRVDAIESVSEGLKEGDVHGAPRR